jgi:hypothetical protein
MYFLKSRFCAGQPGTYLLYKWLNPDYLKAFIPNKTTEYAISLES